MKDFVHLVITFIGCLGLGFAVTDHAVGFTYIAIFFLSASALITYFGEDEQKIEMFKIHQYGEEFFLENSKGRFIPSYRAECCELSDNNQIVNHFKKKSL